ncbi:MAG: SulP family inorganic anion transporter, partial [Candidatus Eremiobacteraeota bacterium]|nr:SulP family inorganic anion transporter [Candidatus Eremiobacteraeota bacterium]
AGGVLVVLLPIQTGMLLAILLSLTHGLRVVMRPPAIELFHVPGTTVWWSPVENTPYERVPGVVVVNPAAAINFINAQYLNDRLSEIVDAAPNPRLVVIEGSSILDLDFTGSANLQRAIERFRRRNIDVALARLINPKAQHSALRTGLIACLGEDHTFRTVQEAVETLTRRY